ncbi:hypothetical protein ASG17_04710 [Brevundimonas sp. Leaf363]|nr:hypothetical protein ASG17_04710 [Brevundimonas sp. Leaf363]
MRLARFSGTEVVVQHTADGLRRAGHEPVVYAPELGEQAESMRVQGHRVVDRLSAVPFRPDVIHAQHVTPTLMAMAAFPDTPVVHVCHSAMFHIERPILHPQIRRHVAVDQLCKERCLAAGVDPERLAVVYNPVDETRFARRGSLPAKPKRALLLTKTREQRKAVADACRVRGIELVELGRAVGRFSNRIEDELQGFDLVFATARMAIEAAAVGCAVVVGDGRGVAGMLTPDRWPTWRHNNLGAALLSQPVTAEAFGAAIDAYDAEQARAVGDAVRRDASLDGYIREMAAIYQSAIDDPALADPARTAMATASLLEDWLPSPAERTWRDVVSEMGWAARRNAELREVEARLRTTTSEEARATRRSLKRAMQDLKAAMAKPGPKS